MEEIQDIFLSLLQSANLSLPGFFKIFLTVFDFSFSLKLFREMANQVDNPNLLAKERDDEIDKLLKIQEEIEKNKKELENDLENSELKEAIERQNKEAANLKNRISVIDKKLKEVKKASESKFLVSKAKCDLRNNFQMENHSNIQTYKLTELSA